MAMVEGIFWFLFSAFVNDLCLLLDLGYVIHNWKVNFEWRSGEVTWAMFKQVVSHLYNMYI